MNPNGTNADASSASIVETFTAPVKGVKVELEAEKEYKEAYEGTVNPAVTLSVDVPLVQTNVGVDVAIKFVGVLLTETIEVDELVHPFASVPVTMYVELRKGLADTALPLEADNPCIGDHA